MIIIIEKLYSNGELYSGILYKMFFNIFSRKNKKKESPLVTDMY